MWITAFLMGLIGSIHCISMCGPIVYLLPLDHYNNKKKTIQLLSYHLGRFCTYIGLGIIMGFLGEQLNIFGLQQQVSILMGTLLIISAFIPLSGAFNKTPNKILLTAYTKLKTEFSMVLKKRGIVSLFVLGILNGLLPCGLLYMALFGSLNTKTPLEGAVFMLCFGLGTIPLMTLVAFLSNFISAKSKQYFTKAMPWLLFILGSLFILRGSGLDIPYLSPHQNVSIQKVSNQYQCH